MCHNTIDNCTVIRRDQYKVFERNMRNRQTLRESGKVAGYIKKDSRTVNGEPNICKPEVTHKIKNLIKMPLRKICKKVAVERFV